MSDQPDDAEQFDREIRIERILPASREQVWEAWTIREQLERWWTGPPLETRAHKFDPRPGGEWTMVSRTGDGKEIVQYLTFDVLLAPERLEFRSLSQPYARFRIALQVGDNGGTRIDYRMGFRSTDYPTTASVGFVPIKQVIDRAERKRIERLAAFFPPT